MNNTQLTATNQKADFAFITPDGISLTNVRGFLASISLSNQRLNAMAALLANTIHNTTKINVKISKPSLL